jgi:hypothetical protein
MRIEDFRNNCDNFRNGSANLTETQNKEAEAAPKGWKSKHRGETSGLSFWTASSTCFLQRSFHFS